MEKALHKAVEIVGGQNKLAQIIGVSQPRLWNWMNRDSCVPAEFVLPICLATENEVKPEDLRPDVFPAHKS